MYVKGFVLPRKWITNEEYVVYVVRSDGVKIEIPIPALKPYQKIIEINKLVIRY